MTSADLTKAEILVLDAMELIHFARAERLDVFRDLLVLAAAELRSGIAITDDREAVKVGRAHGLDVHGTIWLIAGFCRSGKLAETAAGNLVDALRETQLRLPCTGAEFSQYARRHHLL